MITHDDAVVALRRLDVELVLQQEPGGRHRVAEAAEHLGGEADFGALALAALAAARHVPGAADVSETGAGRTWGGLAAEPCSANWLHVCSMTEQEKKGGEK